MMLFLFGQYFFHRLFSCCSRSLWWIGTLVVSHSPSNRWPSYLGKRVGISSARPLGNTEVGLWPPTIRGRVSHWRLAYSLIEFMYRALLPSDFLYIYIMAWSK
jgi:hypothetical protein